MNIIKISEQVFETIQKNNILPIDSEHLPYNTICIAFPYSFLKSADEMIEDSLKSFKREANKQGLGFKKALEDKRQEIETIKQKIINYCNSDLYIIFNIKNFEIIVKHSRPQTIGVTAEQILFNAYSSTNSLKEIKEDNKNDIINLVRNFVALEQTKPIISINEMSNNGIWMYNTLVKLVCGVIYSLNNPKVEVTETQKYLNVNSDSNSQRKNNQHNFRYISNIKYVTAEEKSTSNVENKRFYNMEAWEVRGHWRYLKNGSKIWVNSYVKGEKEKLNNSDHIFKLNKIDFQ